MANGIILLIVAVSIAAATVRGLRALLGPARTLDLSLFRPYRGDPWPRGVQEQYDIRFDMRPRKPPSAPIQPTWSDIVVTPSGGDREPVARPDDVEVEDAVHGETAVTSSVHGDVHASPH